MDGFLKKYQIKRINVNYVKDADWLNIAVEITKKNIEYRNFRSHPNDPKIQWIDRSHIFFRLEKSMIIYFKIIFGIDFIDF